MAVRHGLIIDRIPTSTGYDEYTTPGFGGPDLDNSFAICVGSLAIDGTDRSGNAGMSIGCGDQGSDRNGASMALGCRTRSDTQNSSALYQGLSCISDNGISPIGNNDYFVDFDYQTGTRGWIQNGIKTFCQTTDGEDRNFHIQMMRGLKNVWAAGSTSERYIGSSYPTKTLSIGFKPTLFFGVHVGNQGVNSDYTDARLAFGVAHNSSTDTLKQYSYGFYAEDGAGTQNPRAIMRDNAFACHLLPNLVNTVTLSAFGATQTQWTVTNQTSTMQLQSFAIELDDDDDAHIEILNTPTSTGLVEIECGFNAGCVMVLQTTLETVNLVASNQNAGGVSFGSTDFDSEVCAGMTVEDGEAAGACTSFVNESQLIELRDDEGNALIEGNISQNKTNTSFFLNFTRVHTTAKRFIVIAIKGDSNIEGVQTSFDAYMATSTDAIDTELDAVVSAESPPKISIDRYRHEPVPEDYQPWYFQSEFLKIEVITDLIIRGSVESYHKPPDKVRDGLIVIADGVDWNPGMGVGMYYYYNGGWRFLG